MDKNPHYLFAARFEFAMQLTEIAYKRRPEPLIYIDETTFNTWQRNSKSWMYPETPVKLPIRSHRKSITLYGAIGNCLSHSVFITAGSTNEIDF